jgi:hypothetical protein
MPLAVQKLVVDSFPMPFHVSGKDAMVPGTKLEGAVKISARIDKDGDPMTRQKGDLLAELERVEVGSTDVELSFDHQQEETKTLGGMPRQGMPAGHGMPKGHP